MERSIGEIIERNDYSLEDLIALLNAEGKDKDLLFRKSSETKRLVIGNKVHFRGLVEFSNICRKNCNYCGIRSGNKSIKRYIIPESEVLDAARFALNNGYGSMVIQSGERNDKVFIKKITHLLKEIKELSEGKVGITLSMGEQTEETYRNWFEAGAHRYLIRIETSNRDLYYKIHPEDSVHNFNNRLNALRLLRKIGYNVGTGVMIGLPFQTLADLANDLLFFKEMDIDMAGMGPYIEHKETPLFQYSNLLLSRQERFYLTLKMIALLRIMMPDINIAATTAMQTMDKLGREKALMVGANIIMPNLTPVKYREGYLLYEDKPCINEEASECRNCLEARIHIAGDEIAYNEWGDSKHFNTRSGKRS
jgi:biotin synthase